MSEEVLTGEGEGEKLLAGERLRDVRNVYVNYSESSLGSGSGRDSSVRDFSSRRMMSEGNPAARSER